MAMNKTHFRLRIMLVVGIVVGLILAACSESTTPPVETGPTSTEVTFPTSDNLTLQATLFMPESQARAAVVIVPGSGPVDRDGLIAGAATGDLPPIYRNWADFLLERDIAVLRYDKRFITYPNLNSLQLSQSDQVADIVAAVNYLQGRSDLDPQKIFIIGHSEGGNLAPVAANQIGNIAGLVILAAPAFAVDTLLVEQLRANPDISETIVNDVQAAFELLRNGQFPVGGSILGAGETYWREWITYSEKADSILQAGNSPAFILQGCSDENFPGVTLDANKLRWQDIVSRNFSAYRWVSYTRVTHLILNEETNDVAEHVLQDILDWINRR